LRRIAFLLRIFEGPLTAMEMYKSMEMTFWLPQIEAALAQVERR